MENEVVSVSRHKRPRGKSGPKNESSAHEQRLVRGAALWAFNDTWECAPAAVWGAYPRGFLSKAITSLRCNPSEVLHVCSGSLGKHVGGVRIDLRQEARPDVRADGRNLPFRDSCFGGVLLDPPYAVEFAEDLYGTDYPRPSHLLREAARVVRPGGRVGFLHFLVPSVSKNLLRFEAVRGVTQGCGYRIRAFTLFVRPPEPSSLLLDGIDDERPPALE